MWEHYDDLPFEVFCTDSNGQRHLISRHQIESEAVHSMNAQNRSGGYAAEYRDWRKVELKKGSTHLEKNWYGATTPLKEPNADTACGKNVSIEEITRTWSKVDCLECGRQLDKLADETHP